MDELEELDRYYRELGLSDFIDGENRCSLENLQAARIIVDGFFDGPEVSALGVNAGDIEKRSTFMCLLNNIFLKDNSPIKGSLKRIIDRMNQEDMPDEMRRKMYKAIIYFSVKSDMVRNKKVTYGELLAVRTFLVTYNLIKNNISWIDSISYFDLLYKIKDKVGDIVIDRKEKRNNTSIGSGEQKSIESYYEDWELLDFIKIDGNLIYSYENLSIARQIVEGYFKEDIDPEQKKAILICILGNPVLRTNNVRITYDLSILVDKIKKIGLTEKETFAIIINLAIDGKMLGCLYGEAIWQSKTFIENLKDCPESMRQTVVTPIALQKAVGKTKARIGGRELYEYYERMGVNSIKNEKGKLLYSDSDLYMARQIVEGYFEGEIVEDILKKAVLDSLLKHDSLKLKGDMDFDKLLNVVKVLKEKGLDDRGIYGFLINLSVSNIAAGVVWPYNAVLKEPGKLVNVLRNSFNTIVNSEVLDKICDKKRGRKSEDKGKASGQNKPDRVTNNDGTIRSKRSYKKRKTLEIDGGADEEERKRVFEYYESLGLSDFINVEGNLIYSYENLYVARQIVKEYFEDDITPDQKQAMLICILGTPLLRTNNNIDTYNLSSLISKLNGMGLENLDVLAIIINLSIQGKMLDCSYNEVLKDSSEFIRKLNGCPKNKRQTIISVDTFRKSTSKAKEKLKEFQCIQYYKSMGLIDFIKDKKGRLIYPESNLYMAYQIVEGWCSWNNKSDEDDLKKAILKKILNYKSLKLKGNTNFDKLSELVNIMKRSWADPAIYGFLINLSVSKRQAGIDFGYDDILNEPHRLEDFSMGLKYIVSSYTLNLIRNSSASKTPKRDLLPTDIAQEGLPVLQIPGGSEICAKTRAEYTGMMEERSAGNKRAKE